MVMATSTAIRVGFLIIDTIPHAAVCHRNATMRREELVRGCHRGDQVLDPLSRACLYTSSFTHRHHELRAAENSTRTPQAKTRLKLVFAARIPVLFAKMILAAEAQVPSTVEHWRREDEVVVTSAWVQGSAQ